MSAAAEGGGTYRESLQGLLARASTDERRGQLLAELDGPPYPFCLSHVWTAFIRLHNRRGSAGFGIARISWQDLANFNQLSGLRLVPWEVELIEALDDLFLAEQAKAEDARSKTKRPG